MQNTQTAARNATPKRYPLHWPLAIVSIASFISIIFAAKLLKDDEPNPNLSMLFLALSVFLGIYVLLCLIENKLGKHIIEFKVTLIAWALLAGTLVFYGRIRAITDINEIFHIDASALPLTLLASTATHISGLLFWPVVCILLIAIMCLVIMWAGNYFDEHTPAEEKTARVITIAMVALALLISATFIHARIHNKESRLQIIYRIAHSSDFSSSFRCQGINEEIQSVVFIGPEQRRVLVAPKIEEPGTYLDKKADVLRNVNIPKEFYLMDCITPQYSE
jgi:peptidoglycan/LPS O-acetylase OafA/YrhL